MVRQILGAVILRKASSAARTGGRSRHTASQAAISAGIERSGRRAFRCQPTQFGVSNLERCALRAGNVHSAHGWRDVLEHVVARYRDRRLRRYFRGDAAFASPDLYEFLEAEGYKYAIRLKANAVLQESIVHLLTPPRRSPAQPCSPLPCQLQLSGRFVEQQAPGGRQDRVASGPAISARWRHSS